MVGARGEWWVPLAIGKGWAPVAKGGHQRRVVCARAEWWASEMTGGHQGEWSLRCQFHVLSPSSPASYFATLGFASLSVVPPLS